MISHTLPTNVTFCQANVPFSSDFVHITIPTDPGYPDETRYNFLLQHLIKKLLIRPIDCVNVEIKNQYICIVVMKMEESL